MSNGRLLGLGVGPGDPDLITLKAFKLLQEADVVAYPTGRSSGGNAHDAIAPHINGRQELVPLRYPATAGPVADSREYPTLLRAFYDETAETLAARLEEGKDVAIICLGDPFFYGSYMYWHDRLSERFETIVVPGVSSVMAAPAALGLPLVHKNDAVTVLPGTLPEAVLEEKLRNTDVAVIMKLGRTLPKVVRVLEKLDLLERSHYVERATMPGQRILRPDEVDPKKTDYFSIIIVPCNLKG